MSHEPKKASDEQIAQLRRLAITWMLPGPAKALTAVLDELEHYRREAAKQPVTSEQPEKVCEWKCIYDRGDGPSLYITGCCPINGKLECHGDFCPQCGSRIVEKEG